VIHSSNNARSNTARSRSVNFVEANARASATPLHSDRHLWM